MFNVPENKLAKLRGDWKSECPSIVTDSVLCR